MVAALYARLCGVRARGPADTSARCGATALAGGVRTSGAAARATGSKGDWQPSWPAGSGEDWRSQGKGKGKWHGLPPYDRLQYSKGAGPSAPPGPRDISLSAALDRVYAAVHEQQAVAQAAQLLHDGGPLHALMSPAAAWPHLLPAGAHAGVSGVGLPPAPQPIQLPGIAGVAQALTGVLSTAGAAIGSAVVRKLGDAVVGLLRQRRQRPEEGCHVEAAGRRPLATAAEPVRGEPAPPAGSLEKVVAQLVADVAGLRGQAPAGRTGTAQTSRGSRQHHSAGV